MTVEARVPDGPVYEPAHACERRARLDEGHDGGWERDDLVGRDHVRAVAEQGVVVVGDGGLDEVIAGQFARLIVDPELPAAHRDPTAHLDAGDGEVEAVRLQLLLEILTR